MSFPKSANKMISLCNKFDGVDAERCGEEIRCCPDGCEGMTCVRTNLFSGKSSNFYFKMLIFAVYFDCI
jgi:hypothetical protein